MKTDPILAREERIRRILKWMTTGYMAAGFGLAAAYGVAGDRYLALQALGTVAVLWALMGVLKLTGLKPVYSLYAVAEGFLFAAYTLGVVLRLYKTLPGYDKLLHTFSGVVSMMMALPLFYLLKPGHRVEKSDCALALVFSAAVTMAAAGLWELAEYALSLFSSIDPQCAAATGVGDTMKDMAVCAAGALAAMPWLVRFYRTGEGGLLYTPLEAFIRINLADKQRGESEE